MSRRRKKSSATSRSKQNHPAPGERSEQIPTPQHTPGERGATTTTNILAFSEVYSADSLSPSQLKVLDECSDELKAVILSEWKAEGRSRRDALSFALAADTRNQARGMWFAFLTVVCSLLAAVVLILAGKDLAGGVLGLIPIGFLVDRFIRGRHSAVADSDTSHSKQDK